MREDRKSARRVRNGRLWAAVLAGALLLSAGCAGGTPAAAEPAGPVARVEGKSFCLRDGDGGYSPVFLDGVNIGAAKAGTFPGEFGVTKEEYLRWFGYISAMNVRVIRVYVNQMPAFYDALREYNSRAEAPLYLLHGVYMNEDLLDKYGDVYGGDGAIRDSFFADIRNAVDMIHGNAAVEKLPGSAGGEYTSDVSPWVIGWILGIEWSAELVQGTDAANPGRTEFAGTYVRTEGASPFEAFLASAAEECVAHEMEGYGEQRPVALNNWCTTDPLDHPNEPNAEMEDAAVVDAEHIRATDAFEAGFFASYHVYPYYPDFFSYDTKYREGGDPYLAYLKELNAYHSMPVLVAEYGIPASRGIAHVNTVTGMSQGHASEEQQARWLIALREDIRDAGCMGGLIFAWQDEWFKRTWNSMDYEEADRRPFWLNVQSPEENFGLLAFAPGEKEAAVTLDGDSREWSRRDLLTENDGLRVFARSDAAYLYLLVEGENYDFASDTLYLPLDVLSGQGNTRAGDLTFSDGAEFLVRLHGETDSAVTVDAYYDVFQYDYSERLTYFDALPGEFEKDSGCFNTIWLAMNRPQHLPETDTDNPFERFDTGALTCGNGDPDSGEYNSLADFCAGENCVELRLPWMLIGFMDPSTKQVLGDFHALGGLENVSADGVRVGICRAGSGTVTPMALYTWDNWELPAVRERLKQSYYILRDYFAEQN